MVRGAVGNRALPRGNKDRRRNVLGTGRFAPLRRTIGPRRHSLKSPLGEFRLTHVHLRKGRSTATAVLSRQTEKKKEGPPKEPFDSLSQGKGRAANTPAPAAQTVSNPYCHHERVDPLTAWFPSDVVEWADFIVILLVLIFRRFLWSF